MISRTVFPRGLLALLACLLFFSSMSYARFDVWEPENGVMVRQGRHVDWVYQSVAEDGEGHFLTVWSEAPTGTMDVFAQLFSTDGTPVWPEPVAIATSPYPEQEARVIRTTDGAWIITWMDYEEDPEKNHIGRVFAQKLNDQGNTIWPGGPLQVGEATSSITNWSMGSGFYLFPSPDGGAIIATDLALEPWAQRIAADGSFAWPEAAEALPPLSARPRCIADGSGGVIMLGTHRIGSGPSNLVGQHISADGEFLWGEPDAPHTFIEGYSSSNWRIVNLGSTDWLLSWNNNQGVILVQKYSAEASPLWGDTPVELVSADVGGSLFLLEPIAPGQQLVGWSREEVRRFLRIDSSGDEPLHYFEGGPIELGMYEWIQHVSLIDPFNLLFATLRDTPQGFEHSLRLFAAGGEEIWTAPCFPYPEEAGYFNHYGQVTACLPDGDTFTLISDGRIEARIGMMAHRLSSSDGSLMSDHPIELATGLGGETSNPQICVSGTGLFTAWMDARWGAVPYFQILESETGENQLEPGGRPMFPGLLGQEGVEFGSDGDFDLVSDGSGGLLFARLEHAGSQSRSNLRMQRVSATGDLLWGDNGSLFDQLDPDHRDLDNIHIVGLEDGSSLLFYNRFTELYRMQVGMMKVHADGTPAWDTPVHSLLEGYEEEREYFLKGFDTLPSGEVLAVIQGFSFLSGIQELHLIRFDSEGAELSRTVLQHQSSGEEVSFHVNEDESVVLLFRDSDRNLRLLHVSPEGELLTPEEGILLLSSANYSRSVVWFEESVGIVSDWQDGDRYQRFAFDGTPLLVPQEGVELPAWLRASNSIADPDGGAWLIGYYMESTTADLCYTHVDENGQPLLNEYEDGPVMLCDAWFRQGLGNVLPDGEGGFYAVWNDDRGSITGVIYDDVYAMRVNDFTTGLGERTPVEAPGKFALLPAYPNPFNPSTTLTYTVPEAGQVRLAVYDVLGREVVRLVDGVQPIGTHRVLWQSQSSSGRGVASGTYFIRYDTPKGMTAQRVLLLK